MLYSPFLRAPTAALLWLGVDTTLARSPGPQPEVDTSELVDRGVRQGSGATVAVGLVDIHAGNIPLRATLFISRLDMSPDVVGKIYAPRELPQDALPDDSRFETDLATVGGWALTLPATVLDGSGAVPSRLVLQAVP